MSNAATIESMHITGSGPNWNGKPEVLVNTLKESFALFEKSEGRLPDDREAQMMWVAVQRWHGVDEDCIEPPEMRRQ